jgi:pilus assembly protein CpaE
MSDMTLDLMQEPSYGFLERHSDVHARSLTQPGHPHPEAALLSAETVGKIGRIPRITIHAFCDSPDVAAAVERAASDRLMSRAQTTVQRGGVAAAVALYREAPTPNLILVESQSTEADFIADLDSLADVCDAGTKVVAIGHANDIAFYREIMRRGISEYILAPVQPSALIAAISQIYGEATSSKVGQVLAFIGAKGGTGSSTVAHNVAWSMARHSKLDVIVADMDLPFGTAALNFNIDSGPSIVEALQDPRRIDEVLLDRLLTKCGDRLSLLSAPATLDRSFDLDEATVERLIEVAQASVPFLVLDLPHQWTAWTRNTLRTADEVIITATPNLASLKSTRSLIGFLKQARPSDPPPRVILNQVGMPKRPEITPKAFAEAVQLGVDACIPFDAHLFGTGANNGQMVAEVSARATATKALAGLAEKLTSRQSVKGHQGRRFCLRSLIGKLRD